MTLLTAHTSLPSASAPTRATARIRRRRRSFRLVAGAALTAALALAGTASASAHVRVHADSTAAGSFSALTFRVPTESDTASTVKVEVSLPQDHPLLYVSTKPLPGWKATVAEAPLPEPVTSEGATITKAARTVTWTATDRAAAIAPGQYQEFSISAGPLPGAGPLLLPATQTYSDGTVVAWDQPTPASGQEPEHPAPTLLVTAATGTEDGSAASPPPAPAPATDQAPAADQASAGPDALARGLSGAALVVALGALGVGAVALRRRAGR